MKRYLVTVRAYYPVTRRNSKRVSHYESLIMQAAVNAEAPRQAASYALDDLGIATDIRPPKILTIQEAGEPHATRRLRDLQAQR